MYISIYNGILICIVISIALTIYSYYSNVPRIKIQELKLSQNEILQLYGTRFIHYFISIAAFKYICFIFIFELYDKNTMVTMSLLYIFIYISLHILWRVLGECPFSYIEKKILDPNYKTVFRQYEPWIILLTKQFPTNDNHFKRVLIIHFFILLKSLYILYKNKNITLQTIGWK